MEELFFEPGSGSSYSNTGYIVTTVIMEQINGKSFEEKLADRVLKPLGIYRYGFGHPASINDKSVDQPWGHKPTLFGVKPVSPDDTSFVNPPVFNSAGNLFVSLAGWGQFVRDQLSGRLGAGDCYRRNFTKKSSIQQQRSPDIPLDGACSMKVVSQQRSPIADLT